MLPSAWSIASLIAITSSSLRESVGNGPFDSARETSFSGGGLKSAVPGTLKDEDDSLGRMGLLSEVGLFSFFESFGSGALAM